MKQNSMGTIPDTSVAFSIIYSNTCVPFFVISVNRSKSRDDYSCTVAAYHQFLKTASEWLSRRVTDVCILIDKSYQFGKISYSM